MNRTGKSLIVALITTVMMTITVKPGYAFLGLAEIKIDWDCVNFKIIGVCIKRRKGRTIIVPKVRYWWPRALIEAVPRPGQSMVMDTAAMGEIAKIALATGTGGSITETFAPSTGANLAGGTALAGIELTKRSSVVTGEQYLVNNEKFMEAHVFTFKPPEPCDSSYKFYLSYASEIDAVNWRTGIIDGLTMGIWERIAPLIPGMNTLNCLGLNIPGYVGCWGPLYPRQGRVMHFSDPVVSALLSYRAIDLASNVYHTFGYGSSLKDKMQLAYPRKKGCMAIGTHPLKPDINANKISAGWELSANKPGAGGKYLWVYWKEVECCLW